jgi:hypothetical protein
MFQLEATLESRTATEFEVIPEEAIWLRPASTVWR